MTDLHKEHSDLTARVEALEAENDRLKRLLEERNQISGTVMLQLREIAGAVFQDYPLEDDFARLVSAVKSLVERQPPVPLISALQLWLEAMERRSVHSITKADARLADQAASWLTHASSVAPFRRQHSHDPLPQRWSVVLPLNPEGWQLWTPDFDYDKEPYWVRTSEEMEPVLAYPNAGMLHEMGGGSRYFHPCECEVIFAGWENDPYYPSGPISQRKERR